MKKVIVTGATGFLGESLIRELVVKGIEIIAIVRNDHSDIKMLQQYDNIRIIICSLNDITRLPLLVADNDVDVFYHFAWDGTSGAGRADIQLQLSNVKSTCDAVKAASEIGCRRFINAGSVMVYEALQYIPTDGTTPSLSNIYSTAKLTADFMAKTLAASLRLDYITCIISNIYGMGEKSARLVNSTIRKFFNKEKAAFTEGNQLYDFIYVSDAIRAFYLIGEKGIPYNSYYIGNPIPQPLKNFIIKIRDVVDINIEIAFGEIPYLGAMLMYNEFDTMKLYNEFGFIPEISFEQGIEMTAQWIYSNETYR